MATVQVRYIVHDVEAAIAFYTQHLGFELVMHPAPPFAMLSRGDLRLVLSAPNPSGGGGQSMPDGSKPEPGGWNRFAIEVDDLAATVERLRQAGAHFRNDIVTGVGGKQILLEDPSGNPIELFQPTAPEARLSSSSESSPRSSIGSVDAKQMCIRQSSASAGHRSAADGIAWAEGNAEREPEREEQDPDREHDQRVGQHESR